MTSVLEETREMSVEQLASLRLIPVGKEQIEVGPLVLRQLLALGRLAASVMAKLDIRQLQVLYFVANGLFATRTAAETPAKPKGPARVPAGKKRSGPTPSNGTAPAAPSLDWAPLLMLLDDDTWGQAAHIVTGRPAEWCLDSLTMSALGLVIEAVLDLNEPEVLKRLFTRAPLRATPSTTSSDQGS